MHKLENRRSFHMCFGTSCSTSIDLEWNALWGQSVDSRFTGYIITSQQNNNDLDSPKEPQTNFQSKVHLQRRRETGDFDSHRNKYKRTRQTDRKGEWLVSREDSVNTYQVVNTLSVWATMKDTKAATRGMFVNPAYCGVLAVAATPDSSTPPAVNNLMAGACFLQPYSRYGSAAPALPLAFTLNPVCPPAWIQQKIGKLRTACHRAIRTLDITDIHSTTPASFPTSTVPTAMEALVGIYSARVSSLCLLSLRWLRGELSV